MNEQLLKTSLHSAVMIEPGEATINPETVNLDGWRPDILIDDQGGKNGNTKEMQGNAHTAQILADKILVTWLNSLSGTTSVAKIARDLNTSTNAYEFLISHLAHETQIERLKKRISSRLENWTYGMTLDSNLGAAAKIASDEINAHVYMKKSSSIEEVVENSNVNTFRIDELENPLLKWQNWVNEFGELISKNCTVRTFNNFDESQNLILIENVKKLTPA